MRAQVLAAALALGVGAAAAPALSVEPGERLADPALEARARAISQELRCLVCQNQSIDDSAAPLAHDLRVLVRERLAAGDSDGAVVAYLTHRYGDYVLLRPPFKGSTLVLWLGPPTLLMLGAVAVALLVVRRRRAGPAAPAPLSPEEQAQLDRLLTDEGQARGGAGR
jgi:cytochrome c-type biogenesis protein CcmH